jgi:hypothetical protein
VRSYYTALGPGFDPKHDFIEKHWFVYGMGQDGNGVPFAVTGANCGDPYGIGSETDMENGFMDPYLDVFETVLEEAIKRDVLDLGVVEITDLRDLGMYVEFGVELVDFL